MTVDDLLGRRHASEDRLAGLTQAGIVAVVLTTTSTPTQVWVIRGWVPMAIGIAYALAALMAAIGAPSIPWDARTAGLGVLWWALRFTSYVLMALRSGTLPPWTGAATSAGMALAWALYYRRAIFRAAFFGRLDQIEESLRRDDRS